MKVRLWKKPLPPGNSSLATFVINSSKAVGRRRSSLPIGSADEIAGMGVRVEQAGAQELREVRDDAEIDELPARAVRDLKDIQPTVQSGTSSDQ